MPGFLLGYYRNRERTRDFPYIIVVVWMTRPLFLEPTVHRYPGNTSLFNSSTEFQRVF